MSLDIKSIVRPEVLGLKPYVPAKKITNTVRLNANESPFTVTEKAEAMSLNLYPDAVPYRIRSSVADYLGIAQENCVVTRGSTEAIDILIRTFCSPGDDEIIIFPPTFEMYQFYAAVQGINIVSVPLLENNNYQINFDIFKSKLSKRSKLTFLCSPSNPTGHSINKNTIYQVCESLKDFGLLVLDGAYAEFSGETVYREILNDFSNVVVLRTLSKAFGLAGSRCGALIGSNEICQYIMRVMPPYSFSKPSEQTVLESLNEKGIGKSKENIKSILKERQYLENELKDLTCVERVFPSQTNFVLVKTTDAEQFCKRAKNSGFLLRNVDYQPTLKNCVRITVGTREQIKSLIRGLRDE